MIEQCILGVIESLGDLLFILFGDFNARIGNENSDAATLSTVVLIFLEIVKMHTVLHIECQKILL